MRHYPRVALGGRDVARKARDMIRGFRGAHTEVLRGARHARLGNVRPVKWLLIGHAHVGLVRRAHWLPRDHILSDRLRRCHPLGHRRALVRRGLRVTKCVDVHRLAQEGLRPRARVLRRPLGAHSPLIRHFVVLLLHGRLRELVGGGITHGLGDWSFLVDHAVPDIGELLVAGIDRLPWLEGRWRRLGPRPEALVRVGRRDRVHDSLRVSALPPLRSLQSSVEFVAGRQRTRALLPL
mmetsp:Transcript_54656/g.150533  ORF Transcript_54656/g.150533 Transcript_54656/m.150533 type:complete len:237 (-) Transcript_54656:263-973(-)